MGCLTDSISHLFDVPEKGHALLQLTARVRIKRIFPQTEPAG